jgi:uncharacterized protein YdcH (DUF465 family)
MEITQDQLKAHLMESDEQFRLLVSQHAEYKKRVEELESKSHLTPEEQFEESRLKKLKLRLKDQMTAIMNRHKSEQVV